MVPFTILVAVLVVALLLQTFYLFKMAQEVDRYKKILDTEESVKGRLDKIFENQADVQASLRKELEKEYAVKIAKLDARLREAKGISGEGKLSEALRPKGSLKKAVEA